MKIVGLGTGTPDTLTLGALDELKKGGRIVLQTGIVPVAQYLLEQGIEFETLDALFESSEDFDELIARARDFILKEDCTFGVLGNINHNEFVTSVTNAQTEIIYGLGYENTACILHPKAAVYTATEFLKAEYFDTRLPIVITEVDSIYKAAEVRLKLSDFYTDIEQMGECGYSCMLVAQPAELQQKPMYAFEDLLEVMRLLRSPGGCPWDREQTHASLRQYLLEESYEAIDAIDQNDMDMLYDELGDVLLQVVFHAQIASEHSEFNINNITTAVCAKMISRHTHIFAGENLTTSGQVLANWEKIKKDEKGLSSYTDTLKDIPKNLSALMRAAKIQKKAALVGFDWPDYTGAMDKVYEELDELKTQIANAEDLEGEAGDVLFAVVNVLRLLKVQPEMALLRTCKKFINRFDYMEKSSKRDLKELSLEELEDFWQKSKIIFNK